MNFYTPIYLAEALLRPYLGESDNIVTKIYEIQETHDIGALSSKTFSVTKLAESDREIKTARLVLSSSQNVDQISVKVSDDKQSLVLRYTVIGNTGGKGSLFGNLITEQVVK